MLAHSWFYAKNSTLFSVFFQTLVVLNKMIKKADALLRSDCLLTIAGLKLIYVFYCI
ncbi:hypothetical protein PHSC3_001094 [Chlamydiales bacterium STE3]|nr:hypothetical protein PHSC3_001094 [Chlamydiales bacterium STE3]